MHDFVLSRENSMYLWIIKRYLSINVVHKYQKNYKDEQANIS